MACLMKPANVVTVVYSITNEPDDSTSYNLFPSYWDSDIPTLRIAKSGSEFCDFCTALKDEFRNLSSADVRYNVMKKVHKNHR